MSPIGVARVDGAPAARLAALSRQALDRPLAHPAELVIATLSDEALVLGSQQRASELAAVPLDASLPILRRGSGGAELRVGPGTLWIQLALARSDALVACEPSRLLNRYVRPVLKALTKVGALAHYFDRDWVSVAKRPIGMIALGHDAGTGRSLVEVVLAVRTPFATRARPSYLGKPAATLAELGLDVDLARLGDALVEAHRAAYGAELVELSPFGPPEAADALADLDEPPWAATAEEAIGLVAAGRDRAGRMRIGGELMVSRDALAVLEQALGVHAWQGEDELAAIGRVVDATLGAPGVALVGVKSLHSVRDVVARARSAQ
jgi:hypothetical protein